MKRLQRLANHAADEAHKHWRALLKQARAGTDLAARFEDDFFAGTGKARKGMAREFFSAAHLAHLAALTRPQVLALLSTWLGHAIDDMVESALTEREQRRVLERLVRSQYVVVVRGHGRDGLIVDGHPNNEVVYADLYEMSAAGFSIGGFIYLSKSTGEPFRPAERVATICGMKREFYGNAASDGAADEWTIEFVEYKEHHRVIVMRVDPVRDEDA